MPPRDDRPSRVRKDFFNTLLVGQWDRAFGFFDVSVTANPLQSHLLACVSKPLEHADHAPGDLRMAQ